MEHCSHTMLCLSVLCLSSILINANEYINCPSASVVCPCGQPSFNSSLTVTVETCYDSEEDLCVPCSGQTIENACLRYKQCATCGQGLDRCLTCPKKKYGNWCEKDCTCKHGGHCHPRDGKCLCPRGFAGMRCELIIKGMGHRSHVHRRQIIDDSEVTCPILMPPLNGHVHIEVTEPKMNDAAKYTCNERYTMIGSSVRHCQRPGKWNGDAPTCEKLCPFPSVDSNVKVRVNPDRRGEPHLTTMGNEILSELLFHCDRGFTLSGPPRARCASGVWDQGAPKCVLNPECADPGNPENGKRFALHGPIRDKFQMGTQLFFNCTEGSTLVGPANITCMPFSQWSAPIPLCVPNVISECAYECKSASATVLNLSRKPLVCFPENQNDVHVILHPPSDL